MPLLNPVIDLSRYEQNPQYDLSLAKEAYIPFNRYLEHVSDADLVSRYESILRNQLTFVRPERDGYPHCNVWLSPWFWLRKQIETEAEFTQRGQGIPEITLSIKPELLRTCPSIKREQHGLVARFGHSSWLKDMYTHGRVQIKHAVAYLGDNMNLAQKDDELNSHSYSPGSSVIIANAQGKSLSPIGQVAYTTTLNTDCYILCACNDFDPLLFHDFPCDSCLVIHDVDEFAARLNTAWVSKYGQWFFSHNNVEYFDEYDVNPLIQAGDIPLNSQNRSPISSKGFAFAYQQEYRFWWSRSNQLPNGQQIENAAELSLGSLEDISDFIHIDELLCQ
jgi:hypothetical protein